MAKIRHIAISTEDPEKTAAWYKEVFGLEEVGRSPSGVYLSDGDINFAVLRMKQDVGRRLALLAKNRIYGITGDDTGPTFARAIRDGAMIRVRFTHVSNGLVAHEKPVQSLEVAGADKKFYPANGKIDQDSLLVWSSQVREPVAVRYAWKNSPEANLYSGSGLPAVPFRSDDW